MIDQSIHRLDQLLQDVQEPGLERDQRDKFQGNDDHVALVTCIRVIDKILPQSRENGSDRGTERCFNVM